MYMQKSQRRTSKDEVTVAVPISKKSRRPEGVVVSIDKTGLKTHRWSYRYV